ncbi:MAG: two-component system chemotaxis response regulator CheY [Arenicella sp.]|jgi:two-component system chemotaxis response regulator CheY
MSKKVLIVDDSLYMQSIIKDALESAGYEILGVAGDGESAIDMAIELSPELITLDNILPDMLGLDVIKALKEEKVESKILMVSAVGQQSVINTGIALGADGYLVKPFTTEQLLEKIKEV